MKNYVTCQHCGGSRSGLLALLLLFLALLLPPRLFAQGQQITVKGTIVSPSGEKLPGAAVALKGTSKGVASDANGAFSIEVPSGSTIRISFIGYVTQEIRLGATAPANLTIQLTPQQRRP